LGKKFPKVVIYFPLFTEGISGAERTADLARNVRCEAAKPALLAARHMHEPPTLGHASLFVKAPECHGYVPGDSVEEKDFAGDYSGGGFWCSMV
jgi:hypothetical protein